ncbi:MAG: hypothetical protein QM757_29600 [Paludibaculum sp.]
MSIIRSHPKDTVFARWSIQNTETRVPSSYPPITIPGIAKPVNLGDEGSFAGTSFAPTQHTVASYAKVFTPRLVNELRVGFNRFRLDYTADQFEPGAGLGNQLGIPNSNVTPNEQNLPIFSPANYIGTGQTRSLPIFRRENTFQIYRQHDLHHRQAHPEIRRRFSPSPIDHLPDEPG